MKRLTLSLLFVVVTAVIGLGWAIDQWYNTQYAPQEDPAIKNYRQLGNQLAHLITLSGSDNKALNTWMQHYSSQVQLTPYADFPLPENLRKTFELGEPLVLDSGSIISLNYYLPQQQTVVSFNLSAPSRSANDSSLRWILTLLFYAGVILIVLIWLYPLLTRLNLLRRSARAFGLGDLGVRIPQDSVSYISDIEQEFNRMAQKIENLIADNKLLSRGLSHDLRTPLARLRFGLDVLEEENLTDKQQKTLAHLNRDLISMESLVETLLRYARLEQANIIFQPAALNVHNLLMDLVNNFYDGKIRVHNQPIETSTKTPIKSEPIIFADAEYITMLLHNLLQNAERHGNGKIMASVVMVEKFVILSVEDDGAGIPLAERADVLKPFYRAKAAQNTQGYGMGLAIVDRIAQWHKADVTLAASETLGGLKISVRFTACVHS